MQLHGTCLSHSEVDSDYKDKRLKTAPQAFLPGWQVDLFCQMAWNTAMRQSILGQIDLFCQIIAFKAAAFPLMQTGSSISGFNDLRATQTHVMWMLHLAEASKIIHFALAASLSLGAGLPRIHRFGSLAPSTTKGAAHQGAWFTLKLTNAASFLCWMHSNVFVYGEEEVHSLPAHTRRVCASASPPCDLSHVAQRRNMKASSAVAAPSRSSCAPPTHALPSLSAGCTVAPRG
eukprot:4780783-Pleurochrysis_carterae.AAC.1